MSEVPRSAVPGVVWPAITGNDASTELALQYHLETGQWLSPAQITSAQFEQLGLLLEHAFEQSPFWRDRLTRGGYRPGDVVTRSWFTRLPLLTREELRARFDAIRAAVVPPDHGQTMEGSTTGSTAMPLRLLGTDLELLFHRALTLREALWARRDFSAKLAVMRAGIEPGRMFDWGAPFASLFVTGTCVTRDAASPSEDLFDWLCRERPDYLITYPSLARDLALRAIATGEERVGLTEVVTYGEAIAADLPDLIRRAWGARHADMYSAREVGYIALRCPDQPCYHVQSENVLVEVLDDAGRPAPPGTVGRVVVTALHNFALPLIRYEIGDYAEAADACACGRGLPALTRIMGRVRNMLRLPDGGALWPTLPMELWAGIEGLVRFRLIQRRLGHVEALVVARGAIPDHARSALAASIAHRLQGRFTVEVRQVASIERGPGAKYEDVLCEIAS